jgi:hypothetical protein
MSATEEIDMSELKPPEERGGGLIMWLLGALLMLALAGGISLLMGSIGG